ncbi:MAG: hypothetical protein CM1200mP27_12340 [Chloroflexota bacterium]|nr:MAG: hypothetical protein CM1200mP27_12340 [Chloroflexota bacterium]
MTSRRKPKVYLVGTGGSISFVGRTRTDYINYSYDGKHLTIDELLARVPGKSMSLPKFGQSNF